MRKFAWMFALAVLAMPTAALAQSSGNFAAAVTTTQCVLDPDTGALSGGSPVTMLETTIKTPNSGETALLITPSLVTGLFTDTKISTQLSDVSAIAAVRVHVTLDGKAVSPDLDDPRNPGSTVGVIYDERFQRLSTNLFDIIAECAGLPIAEECNIDLILSTLSAHSFEFVAPAVGGGVHDLVVSWEFTPSTATSSAAACAGPGVVTVQQVKTFSQSGGIVIK